MSLHGGPHHPATLWASSQQQLWAAGNLLCDTLTLWPPSPFLSTELGFQILWCFEPQSKPLKTIWEGIKETPLTQLRLRFCKFSSLGQYICSQIGDSFLPEPGKKGRDSRERGEGSSWDSLAQKNCFPILYSLKNEINKEREFWRVCEEIKNTCCFTVGSNN